MPILTNNQCLVSIPLVTYLFVFFFMNEVSDVYLASFLIPIALF